MIYPRNLAYHRTPKMTEFPKRLETKLSVPNSGVFLLGTKSFEENLHTALHRFPSVLRFFRDGITQANAAPVTSSLPPSRWWQERWKVSYKVFELTGSVKTPESRFSNGKKMCPFFITSNKLLPPFFFRLLCHLSAAGFLCPLFPSAYTT